MNQVKKLQIRLDVSTLPKGWTLRNVSVDWSGEPILLFDEGRPQRPAQGAAADKVMAWWYVTPKAQHILHWTNMKWKSLTLPKPDALTWHVQPFEEGWLLGLAREGHTLIIDKTGKVERTLNLGDASEDIQTTPNGEIWVSYFDEGVFGGGIGQNGLVCFDGNGASRFLYAELAQRCQLPLIDDCYALNVFDRSVWLRYYSDFPLVELRDFELAQNWPSIGATNAFALRGQNLVRFPAYGKPYLAARLLPSGEERTWELVAPSGTNLSKVTDENLHPVVGFQVSARGPRIYVWDEHAVYELPE
jgi:hypothetical protein